MTEQTIQKCKHCDHVALSRGLCSNHYQRARKLVAKGATWEEAAATPLPSAKRSGRPMKPGSRNWLAESMQRLTNDLTEALRLIEEGKYDDAKRVLKGDMT